MQDVWLLCMIRVLNVLYKFTKFRWNTSNDYQVIERKRNNIANDQRGITLKYQKQSYGSYAWHIVVLCSRKCMKFQPNSFNSAQLTER